MLLIDSRWVRCAFVGLGLLVAPVSAQEVATSREPAAADASATPESFSSLREFEAFFRRTSARRGSTPEAQAKAARTMLLGCNRFLEQYGATDEAKKEHAADRAAVWRLKLFVLQGLASQEDASAAEALARSLEEVRSDASPLVQQVAWRHEIDQELNRWGELNEQEATRLFDKISTDLRSVEPSAEQLGFVLMLLYRFDPRANPPQEAESDKPTSNHYLRRLLVSLEDWMPDQSDDAETRVMLEEIAKSRRSVMLPGSKLEVSGTLLDGTEFDGASLKGRVVLIDFWAVWCVNCYREAPELKRLYNTYHDQGFDIVCVSLDDSRENAESYIEKAELPDWPTLIGASPETTSFDHPLAVRCGVTGIPFMLVLDRSGKVACVNTHGEELEQTIRRLLAE